MALGLQIKEYMGTETEGEKQLWPTSHHIGPTPNDPLEDIVLSLPTTLSSERMRFSTPKGAFFY